MGVIEYIELLFTDYTLQTISIGTAVLGAVCGVLGSFAVLKKQSLLGDAISHAALPGIALAFLITGEKTNSVLLLGALISGLLGAYWIKLIVSKTHLKSDTALGLILSVFFGVGMMVLSYIQKQPNANQAGLENYLFGQAATLLLSDVWLMIGVTALSVLVIMVFWKEFKLLLFDVDFLQTLGFRVKLLDMLLTSFIVIAIILGLQTVGVVLMSAMILAPAAAARQWTNRLGVMVFLAAIFGAFSGITGTAISALQPNLSTGPVIVLVASVLVFISFVFSPVRGLLFREIRFWKSRNDLKLHKTLSFMYSLAKTHDNVSHPHAIKILNNFQGFTKKSLKKLEQKSFITLNKNNWSLTEKGFHTAKNLYNQHVVEDDGSSN